MLDLARNLGDRGAQFFRRPGDDRDIVAGLLRGGRHRHRLGRSLFRRGRQLLRRIFQRRRRTGQGARQRRHVAVEIVGQLGDLFAARLDLLRRQGRLVNVDQRAAGADRLAVGVMDDAAGGAEPAIAAVGHLQAVGGVVERLAVGLLQRLGEGREGRLDVFRVQLVRPRLAQVRKVAFIAIAEQAAEFVGPRPLAARMQRILVDQDGIPQADAAVIAKNFDQFIAFGFGEIQHMAPARLSK